MIWWCHWPITHGGRGLKLVEGRVMWLMLVVVCCCFWQVVYMYVPLVWHSCSWQHFAMESKVWFA